MKERKIRILEDDKVCLTKQVKQKKVASIKNAQDKIKVELKIPVSIEFQTLRSSISYVKHHTAFSVKREKETRDETRE